MKTSVDESATQGTDSLATRDAVRTGVDDLIEALAPFADIPGEGSEDYPDDTAVVVRFGRTTHYALRLGDLRRAQLLHDVYLLAREQA